jgi:hypothetical protein
MHDILWTGILNNRLGDIGQFTVQQYRVTCDVAVIKHDVYIAEYSWSKSSKAANWKGISGYVCEGDLSNAVCETAAEWCVMCTEQSERQSEQLTQMA